jgi:ATP-dependent Clp protease ATP-binding subunit ClpA
MAITKEPPRIGRRQIELALHEQHGVSASLATLDSQTVTETLRTGVVGQESAVAALGPAICALRCRAADSVGPLGVLLFIGAAHVGKSFTAELLSRAVFGVAMGRFDLDAFSDRHNISRLIGAAPGFIGHDRPGTLFQFTERNPQGVILLRSWNKADGSVQDYFRHIFRTGEATDSRGRRTSFRSYLFVITVDVDVAGSVPDRSIGFGTKEETALGNSKDVPPNVDQGMLAMLDGVIPFRSLTQADYCELLDRRVDALVAEVFARAAVVLEVSAAAREHVLRVCGRGRGGPRAFLAGLERSLIAPLYAHLRSAAANSSVHVSVAEGVLVFCPSNVEHRDPQT